MKSPKQINLQRLDPFRAAVARDLIELEAAGYRPEPSQSSSWEPTLIDEDGSPLLTLWVSKGGRTASEIHWSPTERRVTNYVVDEDDDWTPVSEKTTR